MDDEVWYVLDSGRLLTKSINPWTCCVLISSRKLPGWLYFFLAKPVIQSSFLDFSQSIATNSSLLSMACCALLAFSLIYARLQFALFFLHLTHLHLHLNSMEDSSGCLPWFIFVIFFFHKISCWCFVWPESPVSLNSLTLHPTGPGNAVLVGLCAGRA